MLRNQVVSLGCGILQMHGTQPYAEWYGEHGIRYVQFNFIHERDVIDFLTEDSNEESKKSSKGTIQCGYNGKFAQEHHGMAQTSGWK